MKSKRKYSLFETIKRISSQRKISLHTIKSQKKVFKPHPYAQQISHQSHHKVPKMNSLTQSQIQSSKFQQTHHHQIKRHRFNSINSQKRLKTIISSKKIKTSSENPFFPHHNRPSEKNEKDMQKIYERTKKLINEYKRQLAHSEWRRKELFEENKSLRKILQKQK